MAQTRQLFHEELASLDSKLFQMGQAARMMAAQAVEALQTGDAAIAEKVISRDDEVDSLDTEIEADAMPG